MSSDLAFYLALFKKRMPVMMVIFSICAAAGIALAMSLPPRFSADATLLVQAPQISSSLLQPLDETDASEQLQIVQRRLLTRANLIDIAHELDVFAGKADLKPDEVVELMRNQTQIRLTSGRNAATLMTISFEALSPKVASSVVNKFVTLVLAEDSTRRLDKAGETVSFFDQQVQNLNDELAEHSAKIVAYKEANKDALPEGLNYRLNRQSTLQERLNLNVRELASLADQKKRLEALGSPVETRTSVSPIQQQLAAARANLSGLLGTLSETNPKVINQRAKVEALEERLANAASSGSSVAGADSSSNLQLLLAELDSKMTFLNDEVDRTKEELAEVSAAIERTPQVSIRLDELEREYSNTQARYTEQVAARSKAQSGEVIVTSAKDRRISVLEQATVPSGPSSPNRKLIAGGGVFAGVALAAAFFVLTELLNRTIRRPVDLTRGLGIQPLATIPYIELPGERHKRRLLILSLVVFMAAAIGAGVWLVHTRVTPVDLLFFELLDRVGLYPVLDV